MSIEAKFKRLDAKTASYEVSFEGESPAAMGQGEDARSKAVSALGHYKQVKFQKEKYLEALHAMERKAQKNGSLTVQLDEEEGIYHSAHIDGDVVYEGYDIDDLNITLSQDRTPIEDRRRPGF